MIFTHHYRCFEHGCFLFVACISTVYVYTCIFKLPLPNIDPSFMSKVSKQCPLLNVLLEICISNFSFRLSLNNYPPYLQFCILCVTHTSGVSFRAASRWSEVELQSVGQKRKEGEWRTGRMETTPVTAMCWHSPPGTSPLFHWWWETAVTPQ